MKHPNVRARIATIAAVSFSLFAFYLQPMARSSADSDDETKLKNSETQSVPSIYEGETSEYFGVPINYHTVAAGNKSVYYYTPVLELVKNETGLCSYVNGTQVICQLSIFPEDAKAAVEATVREKTDATKGQLQVIPEPIGEMVVSIVGKGYEAIAPVSFKPRTGARLQLTPDAELVFECKSEEVARNLNTAINANAHGSGISLKITYSTPSRFLQGETTIVRLNQDVLFKAISDEENRGEGENESIIPKESRYYTASYLAREIAQTAGVITVEKYGSGGAEVNSTGMDEEKAFGIAKSLISTLTSAEKVEIGNSPTPVVIDGHSFRPNQIQGLKMAIKRSIQESMSDKIEMFLEMANYDLKESFEESFNERMTVNNVDTGIDNSGIRFGFEGIGVGISGNPRYAEAKKEYNKDGQTVERKSEIKKELKDIFKHDVQKAMSASYMFNFDVDGELVVPKELSLRTRRRVGDLSTLSFTQREGTWIQQNDFVEKQLPLSGKRVPPSGVRTTLISKDLKVGGRIDAGCIFGTPPVGSIIAYSGQYDPKMEGKWRQVSTDGHQVTGMLDGWMLCDGRSLKREDYPELYDAIHSRYGAGSGEKGGGEFNIPDLRGQFLRGDDPTGTVDVERDIREPSGKGIANDHGVGTKQSFATNDPGFRTQTATGITTKLHPDNKNEFMGDQGLASLNNDKRGGVKGGASEYIATAVMHDDLRADKNRIMTGSVTGFHLDVRVDPTPLTGGAKETRPVNVSVNWIIRVR